MNRSTFLRLTFSGFAASLLPGAFWALEGEGDFLLVVQLLASSGGVVQSYELSWVFGTTSPEGFLIEYEADNSITIMGLRYIIKDNGPLEELGWQYRSFPAKQLSSKDTLEVNLNFDLV